MAKHWTRAHDKKAKSKGWSLFDCDGSVDGNLQLCKLDEPEEWEEWDGKTRFNTDADAWEFVYKQFQTGDTTAIRAFELLETHNPSELARIKAHVNINN